MGFDASLKVAGDTRPIAAHLEVGEGRLQIKAADQVIGDWRLKDLEFERTGDGFRVGVEGEQLVLQMSDAVSFGEAVGIKAPKQSKSKALKAPRVRAPRAAKTPKAQTPKTPVSTAVKPADSKVKAGAASFLAWLDRVLERAEKSYGSLLPAWVFTRAMAAMLGLLVVTMLILPSIVSTILLITGFGVVVFGAVVYTDSGLAAKMLPGRATANHVLIAGVGVLAVGFLLAVVAT